MNKPEKDNTIATCNECGSEYIARLSKMAGLCPECAHVLYGYENCNHTFEDGRCIHCYWNGNTSAYISGLKKN